jgi:hypothetical protein
MKLSIHAAAALALLPLQSVYAQGVKRDILGVSLGMPLPEVASREIIASAGEWTPPQEQLVPVSDYKCKKLGTPWKLSSGELSCKINKLSHLFLDGNYPPPCQRGKLSQISYIAECRNFESNGEPEFVL